MSAMYIRTWYENLIRLNESNVFNFKDMWVYIYNCVSLKNSFCFVTSIIALQVNNLEILSIKTNLDDMFLIVY